MSLTEYGFHDGNYERIIVTWGWKPEALVQANIKNVGPRPSLHNELAQQFRGQKHYFTDDTVRTLHLMDMALRDKSSTIKAIDPSVST